jgi:hypothetical protein
MSEKRFALVNSNTVLSDNQQKNIDGWNVMSQITSFVEALDLPGLDTEQGDIFKIITSVPSPWARAYMMSAALKLQYKYMHEREGLTGMNTLYAAMQDEFKGILACLALYNDRIRVQKVDLKYSEKVSPEVEANAMLHVKNMFEVSGAFGNMLFDDRPLWGDPKRPKNDPSSPYFQLILMDNVVIGATSPLSLVYSAAEYNLEESHIPFYRKGRFTNPVIELGSADIQRLYHYVLQIKANIEVFEKEYPNGIDSLLAIREFFREWAQELKDELIKKDPDFDFKERGLLETCDKFSAPFDKLFNIETKIYKTKDGKYLLDKEPGTIEFNPSELLLSGTTSKLIKLDASKGFNPALSTVLKAELKDKVGEYAYFSLPLSAAGLAEFYNSLDELLNGVRTNRNLFSTYDPKLDVVEVTLELSVGGFLTAFKKQYNVYNSKEELSNNVILWPNFISPNWNKYFLYSDLLHNDENIRAIPIIASKENHNELCFNNRSKGELFDIGNPNHIGPKARLKVGYNRERVKQRKLKYEIFESEVPFKGIELQFTTDSSKAITAGYVLINTSRYEKDKGILDHTHDRSDLGSVNVGIDFGSTNSCVTYTNDNNGDSKVLSFENRRRFILGFESNVKDDFAPAHDLFFFQNDNQDGIIKSVLLLNNELRLSNPEHDKSESVSGGFPLFESNLNILSGDETMLELGVNGESEKVLHDLKWKREDKFLVNKKAFVKMLWLYINAELFEQGLKPKNLLWAYPSSMPKDLRRTYEFIYKEAVSFETPIVGADVVVAKVDGGNARVPSAITESEAVCNFALSKGGISLGDNTLFIGFDVGGVTSDILLLANDKSDQRGVLEMQSSVKVAADRISRAVSSSKDVHRVLKHYCSKYQLPIKAIDSLDSNTAPYFLNVIFGLIENDPKLEQQLYSQFWAPELEETNRSHTRGILALAAYITGMLVFHSGQMARAYIEKQGLTKDAKKMNIRLAYFGKGGKLFEWIPKAISEHTGGDYFKNCFKQGLGSDLAESMLSSFQMGTKKEFLKREVAYGLSSPVSVDLNAGSSFEIVGEDGYLLDGKPVKWNEPVTPQMIFEFGEKFALPESLGVNPQASLPRFNAFLDIYFELIKDWHLFDYTILQQERYSFALDELENYVKTDEDWQASSILSRRSQLTSDFKFSCSPFLYQSSCFLDKVIMPKLFS